MKGSKKPHHHISFAIAIRDNSVVRSPTGSWSNYKRAKWWWGILLFSAATLALAAHAGTPAQNEARAQSLYAEVRCVVCQGESIADSEAAIAADMRREIKTDIDAGMSDADIRKSLYDHYGDYVLFRPRLSKANILLWALPPVIVVTGILFLFWRRKKYEKSETYELSDAEAEKLRDLTKD